MFNLKPITISILLLSSSLARAEGYRVISKGVADRWSQRCDQAQTRILQRRPVRRPSSQALEARLGAAANIESRTRAHEVLSSLRSELKSGAVQRATRRGYGSLEVEYSAKGIAKRLGLKTGQSIEWQSKLASHSLKVEGAGRVTLTARPHDRYVEALRRTVGKIVAKVVTDPSVELSAKEQSRLALAPTDMRAEALARHGFKLKREQRGAPGNLKYLLEVKGEQNLKVFSRVFGPGVSTYLPGKGHSQYIHNDRVVDYFFAELDNLRSTNRVVYPVMLSVREGQRLDLLSQAVIDGYSYGGESVQGPTKGHGRPKGSWPPHPRRDKTTGNTCTTTHHRAPVGERRKEMVWLDQLDRTLSSLVRSGRLKLDGAASTKDASVFQQGRPVFLTWLSRNWRGPERIKLVEELIQNNRGSIDRKTYKHLTRLSRWVRFYNKVGLSEFPLELLGRRPLKELMGVKHDPKRLGTTDPLGPGFGRQMYSAAPERIPVVVRLKKD